MTTLIHRNQREAPTEREITKHLKDADLVVETWNAKAGNSYPMHKHAYTKIIFCIKGSIQFTTFPDHKTFEARTGDKLLISPNIEHSAIVGFDGVTCIEAHQHD